MISNARRTLSGERMPKSSFRAFAVPSDWQSTVPREEKRGLIRDVQ
jgi:hypothetical protein